MSSREKSSSANFSMSSTTLLKSINCWRSIRPLLGTSATSKRILRRREMGAEGQRNLSWAWITAPIVISSTATIRLIRRFPWDNANQKNLSLKKSQKKRNYSIPKWVSKAPSQAILKASPKSIFAIIQTAPNQCLQQQRECPPQYSCLPRLLSTGDFAGAARVPRLSQPQQSQPAGSALERQLLRPWCAHYFWVSTGPHRTSRFQYKA